MSGMRFHEEFEQDGRRVAHSPYRQDWLRWERERLAEELIEQRAGELVESDAARRLEEFGARLVRSGVAPADYRFWMRFELARVWAWARETARDEFQRPATLGELATLATMGLEIEAKRQERADVYGSSHGQEAPDDRSAGESLPTESRGVGAAV